MRNIAAGMRMRENNKLLVDADICDGGRIRRAHPAIPVCVAHGNGWGTMCRNVAALGLLLYAWREAGCAPSDAQLARYAHVPYFQDGRFQAWRELPYMPEKRRGRAALAREELPPLDFVLITHDHYDHLEAATIRHFARQATVPRFIVPLGLGVRLQGWGIPADKITELGWAESTTAGAIILTAVPAGAFG